MRGVCPMRPQPQVSLTRKRGLIRATRIPRGTRPMTTSNPSAVNVGDIRAKPFDVCRETLNASEAASPGKAPNPATHRPHGRKPKEDARPDPTLARVNITHPQPT